MIITDRPRSDVVMDLDSKVNKSTLKLTINSDLSHKWLYAWLRHKHMQYELGRISIAICVSGRRLSTRRYISTIEPKRTLSGTWGPKTLRSFTPSYCGPCSKSQIEYLRACAVSLANICNNWRRTSWKSITCTNFTRVHTGYLGCYNSTTNYCRKGHATGFVRMTSLQRLELKLAECSRGVITNESPCDAYDGEPTFRSLEGDSYCEHLGRLQCAPGLIGWGRKPQFPCGD